MNENTHTPEPWSAETYGIDGKNFAVVVEHGDYEADQWRNKDADKARIVACVNGCRNIQDPENTVPELVKALERCLPDHEIDENAHDGLVAGEMSIGDVRAIRAALAKVTGKSDSR